MIRDVTGQIVCQGCKSHFPKGWLRDPRSGAKTVGIFAFCSGKCVTVWSSHNAMIKQQIELMRLVQS